MTTMTGLIILLCWIAVLGIESIYSPRLERTRTGAWLLWYNHWLGDGTRERKCKFL